MSNSKKRTFSSTNFFRQFSMKYFIISSFFSKSRKKRTFLDFRWRIGVRFFFSWILQKRTSIRHWKSAKISQFWHVQLKKTHLFFDQFGQTIIHEIFYYFNFFFKINKKNAPFWILADELGCFFFFMNIGKTHLNSSLKIGLFNTAFRNN